MKNFIKPALADLKQDIAGPIPVDLIGAWLGSEQDAAAHERILDPYKRVGTIVCSDAAGLSKLSAGRPPIEIMKLVSEPKEIIYSYGSAIGGKAAGIWAADNTQMFYEEAIDLQDVVTQMVAAQHAFKDMLVKVGIGIHSGIAYEIGGGLYGEDADTIEEFTEEKSEGNDVLVSPRVKEQLRDPFVSFESHHEMFRLDYTDLHLEGVKGSDVYYPAPFDRRFHNALFGLQLDNPDSLETLHKERVHETSIVLFRIFSQPQARLLDTFAKNMTANTLIHQTVGNYKARLVKSNGVLAIISCEQEGDGVDLAIALHKVAKENSYIANVGVCRGETLIFDLENGSSDLAGGPVNIASKIAEDIDARGVLSFEASVADHAKRHGFKKPFSVIQSGVEITGVRSESF